MKRIVTVLVVCFVAVVLVISVLEVFHYRRVGYLFGYGPHIDVILGNSSIGRNDTYCARLSNLSLHSVYVEGCRLPGGYAGKGIMYSWDIQRWNASRQLWESLGGADHWVEEPFGGFDNKEKCAPNALETTRIRPFRTAVLGWVYKDWVTSREPIRMAIHTSLSLPTDRQPILYTRTFVVDGSKALPPLENF